MLTSRLFVMLRSMWLFEVASVPSVKPATFQSIRRTRIVDKLTGDGEGTNVQRQNRHEHRRLSPSSLAALVVAMAGWVQPMTAAEVTHFKVGISEPVNTVLALWMAQTGGFYAAQGLDVEIINMNGGSRGAQELQSGRIDAMHVGLSSVVKLNENGGDLRTIASLSNVIRFTFFTAPGVKTAAELKGGVIGVSAFGSESDSTVTLALARLGMRRDDVVLKEYGGGTRRLEALKSGEIKGTAINEPVASLAREAGLTAMVDLVGEKIPWLFSSIVVKASYLDSHRDVLTRFLKASIEGNYLALTDEKRAKQVLAREARIVDLKIIDTSYNDFKQQSPVNLEPSRPGAQNIVDQFPALKSRNVDDYVDTSILEGLRKEGFLAEIERKYVNR
jgi:ABC-type nitrate/sulfonate/bicarbonate transport system substrate-binding protein